jgi:general secretion pathway protein A
MFCEFFGLREQPFEVTPAGRFLYLSETHRETLASLTYRLQAGRGFVGVVAPPGMGKTTLLFRLLEDLRGTARTAFIFQTQCTSIEFMRFLIEELELGADDEDPVRLHQMLKRALLKERIVIVIDEAQNLSNAVLEQVRLISNFETPRAKLLQIVLSGQPQLATKLSHPDLLQLRQRLSIFCRLQPFSVTHTTQYIEHRLKVAGHSGAPVFSRRAVEEIARLSGGVPRLINNICFNALSVGFAARLRLIDAEQVREGAADLRLIGETPAQPESRPRIAPGKIADKMPDKIAGTNVLSIDSDKANPEAGITPVITGTQAPKMHSAQTELKPTAMPSQQQVRPKVTGSQTSPSTNRLMGKQGRETNPVSRKGLMAVAALALALTGFLGFQFVRRAGATEPLTITTANESNQSSVSPPTPLKATTVGVHSAVSLSIPLRNTTHSAVGDNGTKIAQQKPILIYQGVVQERSDTVQSGPAVNPHPEPTKTVAMPPEAGRVYLLNLPPSLAANASPVTHPATPVTKAANRPGSVNLPSPAAETAPVPPHARIESKINPRYPKSALDSHVGGVVVLDVDVDGRGSVEQLHVIEGNVLLSNAVIQAVRLWKFLPATVNGKPTESLNRLKFTFRLSDHS